MTVKAGRNATAIRKAIVPPRARHEVIGKRCGTAARQIVVGDIPAAGRASHGPVAFLDQRREVSKQLVKPSSLRRKSGTGMPRPKGAAPWLRMPIGRPSPCLPPLLYGRELAGACPAADPLRPRLWPGVHPHTPYDCPWQRPIGVSPRRGGGHVHRRLRSLQRRRWVAAQLGPWDLLPRRNHVPRRGP